MSEKSDIAFCSLPVRTLVFMPTALLRPDTDELDEGTNECGKQLKPPLAYSIK